MNIIKKKLNENELINEQYSLIFNKVIENYHVVKDFNNCIEWIINDIKEKFLKDLDNINDEELYFTGYYWTISERKCSKDKIDKILEKNKNNESILINIGDIFYHLIRIITNSTDKYNTTFKDILYKILYDINQNENINSIVIICSIWGNMMYF